MLALGNGIARMNGVWYGVINNLGSYGRKFLLEQRHEAGP